MKLFRKKSKTEDDLLLDTDEEDDDGALVAEAGAGPDQAAMAPPLDDPLGQIFADAANEISAEEKSAEGGAPPAKPDDPLDASLMDLFREAKKEVEEDTLASELENIPIQDLLGDLVSVSQELGIKPRIRPSTQERTARNRDSEPDEGGK